MKYITIATILISFIASYKGCKQTEDINALNSNILMVEDSVNRHLMLKDTDLTKVSIILNNINKNNLEAELLPIYNTMLSKKYHLLFLNKKDPSYLDSAIIFMNYAQIGIDSIINIQKNQKIITYRLKYLDEDIETFRQNIYNLNKSYAKENDSILKKINAPNNIESYSEWRTNILNCINKLIDNKKAEIKLSCCNCSNDTIKWFINYDNNISIFIPNGIINKNKNCNKDTIGPYQLSNFVCDTLKSKIELSSCFKVFQKRKEWPNKIINTWKIPELNVLKEEVLNMECADTSKKKLVRDIDTKIDSLNKIPKSEIIPISLLKDSLTYEFIASRTPQIQIYELNDNTNFNDIVNQYYNKIIVEYKQFDMYDKRVLSTFLRSYNRSLITPSYLYKYKNSDSLYKYIARFPNDKNIESQFLLVPNLTCLNLKLIEKKQSAYNINLDNLTLELTKRDTTPANPNYFKLKE